MNIQYERAVVKLRVTDVDGDDLEMFGIQDSGPNVKECWIPSEEGQNFRIEWEAKAPACRYKKLALRAIPYLDELKMEEGILTASQRANGEHGRLGGQHVDINASCPFQFAKLDTTNDIALEGYRIHPSDLNTIKVVVEWGRSKLRELSPEDVHAATLGKPVVSTTTRSYPYTYTFRRDSDLDRFTFVFRYASLEWLREQGITLPPKRRRRTRPRTHTPDYIDVDALDEGIKPEPETSVGISQHVANLQATFLDSDEEIELLGYKVPSGTQRALPVKAEGDIKVEQL